MRHVHSQMTCLGQEVLQLDLFKKQINNGPLQEICSVYEPTFNSMLSYRLKPSLIYVEDDNIVERRFTFPTSFLKEHVPVQTPGDGNCLFYAVSIALNGKLDVIRHLRLLTVFVFLHNISAFMSIILPRWHAYKK